MPMGASFRLTRIFQTNTHSKLASHVRIYHPCRVRQAATDERSIGTPEAERSATVRALPTR